LRGGGKLFDRVVREGKYKFPPTKDDILISNDSPEFIATFNGQIQLLNGRKKIFHDKGFAWADTHLSKWIAVDPNTYKLMTEDASNEDVREHEHPDAALDCALGEYKIYNITRTDDEIGYDTDYQFVVSAKNETDARQLCNKASVNESNKENYKNTLLFWNDKRYSKCELIGKSCVNEDKVIASCNTGS
jgi:hypothetical protein